MATSSTCHAHRVSRFLGECVPRVLHVRCVDFLCPVLQCDLLECHRHGRFAVVQDLYDILRDGSGASRLLLCCLPWPHLLDHIRHGFLIVFLRHCHHAVWP